MRLKDYQAAVLDKLSSYLKLLSEQAAKAEKTRAAIAALPEEARSNLTAPLEPKLPHGTKRARRALQLRLMLGES